jgi:hypothetical protein
MFWDGTQWVAGEHVSRPSSPRRAGGRIRGALITTAIAAALLAVPASTLAKGGSSGGTTPWIALASVNGSAAVHPTLGSWVGFATGYPSTTKNPWVSLTCVEGSTIVYVEGGSPSHTFLLGGGSSVWLTTGGTATCTAELGDLYWRGGHEYYTYLATTSFGAN